LSRKTLDRRVLAAAFDFARLACGDWERERFWNWNGKAEADVDVDLGVDVEADLELMLMLDVGLVTENGDDCESGVAFNVLTGVEGGGMRFAFRDVRSGEGVCGA
jgi:hypothetical protein